MTDPVRTFEQSHVALTTLALEARAIVESAPSDRSTATQLRQRLLVRLELLREELLSHFAKEEEGLFPFIRQNLPAQVALVDRLTDGHDAICGALLRLAHFVEREREALGTGRAALVDHYERFQNAYTKHSQDEAALFEALNRSLDGRHRVELAEILRGL
jgi:iron-sulfur cluster repair protein YtfE (RIC family)